MFLQNEFLHNFHSFFLFFSFSLQNTITKKKEMSDLNAFFSNPRTSKNTSTSSRSCQPPQLVSQSSNSSILSFDSDDSVPPLSSLSGSGQRNDNGIIITIFVFIRKMLKI